MKWKRTRYAPPFGISQEAINKLILLQRRDIEYDGFVKGNDLLKVRSGTDDTVVSDFIPDGAYDFGFHTHPTTQVGERDYGERKLSKKEFKCALEKALLESKPISGYDAQFAAIYRSKLPSLMIWEHGITLHKLGDPGKWQSFKERVKSTLGDDKEEDIEKFFDIQSNKMYEEEANNVYDRDQNFSMCGELEIWKRSNERWNEFFEEIGLEVIEKPIKYMKKKRV